MSVYDFVIARLEEKRAELPRRHWWDRFNFEHREINRTINFAETVWNQKGNSLTAIHTMKLLARQFRNHPDYRPVWDSNEWFVA